MTAPVQAAPASTEAAPPWRNVIKRMAQILLQQAIVLAILLIAAGRLDWEWAWAFAGAQVVMLSMAAALMFRRGQFDVMVERSKLRADAKTWDKRLVTALLIPGLALYVTVGLDERFGWTAEVGLAARLIALAVFGLGYAVIVWAMVSNPFFATLVAIQSDRGHHAMTGGPYRTIRHPGYAAMIASTFATCVLLGSLWGLIPAAAYMGMMVVRAALEDRTLQAELPGYAEYAQQTRYRLIPGVW